MNSTRTRALTLFFPMTLSSSFWRRASISLEIRASSSKRVAPAGAGKAAITGDFVLTAEEVNPVIRTLRANGIEVTALHNHMLDDEPRLFFMHFWANDDALKLARGLRIALGHVKVARP